MAMYLYKQKKKNGDIYLSIKEKYYIPGVGARDKTIENLGCVSKLKEQYTDPIAHFTAVAKQMTEERKALKNTSIMIDMTEKMAVGADDWKNVGYGILKELYYQLELDRFWRSKMRGKKIKYNLELIFRLLVISRILYPGSKKETYENRGKYFEKIDDFSLDDVYNALDLIAENEEAMQTWIYKRSLKICKRDLSVQFFDCTNYYFDIGRPDVDLLDDKGNVVDEKGNRAKAKYRKRGPEKNRRPDPIVGMGLLIDRNGIPLAYDLFPGNESEKVHMRPILNRVKTDFSDGRTIIVADRGLNTSDNIYFINGDNKGEVNKRDGYVYGQSVRGASEEFKTWLLEPKGYRQDTFVDEDGKEITFTHKSRIFPKELNVNLTVPGQKKKKKKRVVIDQKQMVYYSEKYAKKQRRDREAMIVRAKDLILHPKRYDKITSAGSASYVKNIAFNKDTGEIVDGVALSLDLEKIQEEEKYDGYYSIVTSELKMSDHELRNIYRGLARIEDAFKVSKTEFEARPIFVWTNEHIDAHFATCFTALVLMRLLEEKLDHQFPVGTIIESLRNYGCVRLDANSYQVIRYDNVLAACAKAFDKKLNRKYLSRQEVQRLLRY